MQWLSRCRAPFRQTRTGVLRRLASGVPARGPRPAARLPSTALDDKIAEFVATLELMDQDTKTSKDLDVGTSVRYGDAAHLRPDLDRLRVVPQVPSFYMSNPAFEEATRKLRHYLNIYKNLPLLPAEEYVKPQWINPSELSEFATAALKKSQGEEFLALAERLDRIDPQLQPAHLRTLLAQLKRRDLSGDAATLKAGPVVASLLNKSLDAEGRAVVVGRRKTSSARLMVARAPEGQPGEIRVNGRSLEQFFPMLYQRERVTYPLKVVDGFAKFNVFATVQGGGHMGQADAVAQGLAKALVMQNPLFVPRLKRAGCLKRDIRNKERKKPGKPKARASYTWVKR